MSANAYVACPRCVAALRILVGIEAAEVQAAYGTAPLEEFDRMRSRLAADRAQLERLASGDAASHERDVRVDYEFVLSPEGRFVCTYNAICRACGWSHTHHVDEMLDVTTKES